MGLILKKTDKLLFKLLQFALDTTGKLQGLEEAPSEEEWKAIYKLAKRQSVLGVVFNAVKKLPENFRPARALLLRWSMDAEGTAGMNKLLNLEAARLTRVFEGAGRKNAILKGPANARLYPDPYARQCGDIDIWVEGGRQKLIDLLQSMNLIEVIPKISWFDYKTYRKVLHKRLQYFSQHHIHLHQKIDGVSVEVHFRPSPSVHNPIANRRMQHFLENEIKTNELVAEGFYVPSIKFALVMQLTHIQHHFFDKGIGLKQLIDY